MSNAAPSTADKGGGGPGAGRAAAATSPQIARPISGSAFSNVSASSARMARRTPRMLTAVIAPTSRRIVAARPAAVPSGGHKAAA